MHWGLRMSALELVLLDVSEAHRRAFSDWAVENGFRIHATSLDRIGSIPAASIALCVVETRRELPAPDLTSIRKLVRAPIVVLAREIRVAEALRLVRCGVRDVIELPASPRDVVTQATETLSIATPSGDQEPLIGMSAAMRRVKEDIAAVAPLSSNVLITGDTGTGKGVAARMIHARSKRSDRNFVHVDCGALAESVVESELFGHERGAFTGATDRRLGRFEQAGDGTIFLDEVGELSAPLQAKLLRVLQDRQFERLGGNATTSMHARVIAATNRDPEREVREGRFRMDLLYRLNVFRIQLPPLRERLEDLPALIRHCTGQIAARLDVAPPELADSVVSRLAEHNWPGNIRELGNVLERLLIHHQTRGIDAAQIDSVLGQRGPRVAVAEAPEELPTPGSSRERELIEAELIAAGGNVARVARRLGIARSTLRYRMSLHELSGVIPED
jgi:DNA-binding NtrC family response regulator